MIDLEKRMTTESPLARPFKPSIKFHALAATLIPTIVKMYGIKGICKNALKNFKSASSITEPEINIIIVDEIKININLSETEISL